jgi:hypothetical protein
LSLGNSFAIFTLRFTQKIGYPAMIFVTQGMIFCGQSRVKSILVHLAGIKHKRICRKIHGHFPAIPTCDGAAARKQVD